MDAFVALGVLLVGTAVACAVLLVRRERHRNPDDKTGLLIEHQRTAQAVHLRRNYSSAAVHHGNGLNPTDIHKYYS
ncbi:hypothetical protein ACFC1R_28365 [Kitasatospora sp. NPDC056138]|uniref:hypothetical protein n=1 Tax=Kitasatospora sp. NPDC056138 TaxID=3345724 RepID=UPI0035D9027F